MRDKSDRYKSRRETPWDDSPEMTTTQEFISKHYKGHYMQRHPRLEETVEVELINSFTPKCCPFCSTSKFMRNGHTKIGVQRYKCSNKEYGQIFLPTTVTT